ncbi:acyltransferase [Pseudobutyrivibrio xylanivorans]|uniref:Surface polysaccharide O-acyltransferase, integral membrane enzyme n=1 Tax=Pseudobutyrivibrio xylanivorans TaxID=185007 RepID=A0A1G5RT49_PSEXY|nr:acyltransferase [Pseudobutyrivibrio xylanivorans]SCZ77018.1 Surface polysaccharide O-acyltransferase, integral membrane enzyme [Pseudobutyrivibrio xylanivorans]
MKKIASTIYWTAIAACGLVLLNYTSYVKPQWIFFGIAAAIGCGICIFKSYKNEDYVAQTLAIPKNNNRNPVYDYLRLVAVLLVIIIHVLNLDLRLAADMAGTGIYNTMNYIRCWSGNCNTFFIMISGALLLVDKDESVFTFYKKRLLRIAIPLVVYYLWYLWQYEKIGVLTWKEIAYKILSADVYTDNVPHFWLVYEIVAIYVAVPFLRIMLKNMSYTMLTQLVTITYVLSIFMKFFPNQIGTIIPLSGWCGVAIIGYWYSREESRNLDTLMIVAGVLVSILTYFKIDPNMAYQESMTGLTHYFIITVLAVFAICFKLQKHLKNFYFLRLVSKYSYGILLIHMWVLFFVVKNIIHISSVMYKGVGFILLVIATLLISTVAAYLIENLFIDIFNTVIALFDKNKN